MQLSSVRPDTMLGFFSSFFSCVSVSSAILSCGGFAPPWALRCPTACISTHLSSALVLCRFRGLVCLIGCPKTNLSRWLRRSKHDWAGLIPCLRWNHFRPQHQPCRLILAILDICYLL
jgi:hypothetical protein